PMRLAMSECFGTDSPLRGWTMPRAYSGDLRERVIEAVEHEGASRREAAERFGISASSGIKWLQRWHEIGSAAAKPRGGSISPVEKYAAVILGLVAEQPDLTLKESVAELLKRRIRTSQSALSRFFRRHSITFKKKRASRRARVGRRSPGAATLETRARHA